MAGTTSTTTPGMQKAAGFLSETQAVAQQGVSTVSGQLAALKSTWTGDASGAFDNAMKTWADDCYLIINKLGEMIDLMGENRQIITAGEQANTDAALNLRVGPGLDGL